VRAGVFGNRRGGHGRVRKGLSEKWVCRRRRSPGKGGSTKSCPNGSEPDEMERKAVAKKSLVRRM